ncbi:hypothetical protein Tco_1262763 [Tanacetum coccineum]
MGCYNLTLNLNGDQAAMLVMLSQTTSIELLYPLRKLIDYFRKHFELIDYFRKHFGGLAAIKHNKLFQMVITLAKLLTTFRDGGSKQEKETDDLQTTIRKCSGVEEKETDPQKTIRRCSGVDSTDTITIARRPSCAHLCPVQVMAQPPLISDEIFSCENLHTLSLKLDDTMDDLLTMSKRKSEHALHMKTELFRKKNFRISSNPVIACVNLRVLELVDVHISEEVLHNLLSTSKLLEKINLQFLKGLKKIKVSNLCYLQELKVAPRRYKDILEIHDVPSLRIVFLILGVTDLYGSR